MRCQRCGNEDMNYFYQDEGVWYCRKCIGFGRVDVGKEPITRPCMRRRCKCHYTLSYPLTPKQQVAVVSIMQYLKEGKDVLVYAACGAGKTELTMEAIQWYLCQGKWALRSADDRSS